VVLGSLPRVRFLLRCAQPVVDKHSARAGDRGRIRGILKVGSLACQVAVLDYAADEQKDNRYENTESDGHIPATIGQKASHGTRSLQDARSMPAFHLKFALWVPLKTTTSD
jgi:hypothetical protein